MLGNTGAYGLPKLPGGSAFRLYDDFSEDFLFEYPRSWVGRSNSQREGVYVSDFNVPPFALSNQCRAFLNVVYRWYSSLTHVSCQLGAGIGVPYRLVVRGCMHGRCC